MLNLDQFLKSLIHSGIDETTDESIAKHMAITHQLTLTWIPIVTVFLITFYLAESTVFTMGMAGILATHIFIFYFSKRKWFTLTRVLEIIVPVSAVLVGTAFDFPTDFGIRAVFSMYIIAFSVLPFLFFSLQEKRSIIFCYAWIIASWFSFEHLHITFGSEAPSPLLQNDVFVYLAGLGAFLLLLTSVLYFKTTNHKYEKTIRILMTKTQSQNEEIISQSETLEKQNTNLIKQQKHIIHSLNYASHIQDVVFQSDVIPDQIIKDCFTLNKPRDIVSGDFLWQIKIGDTILICVADCTGHGVPGALTSMLAVTCLNEIINLDITIDCASILSQLNDKVATMLKSNQKKELFYHGLDVSLIAINSKDLTAQYASARSSILLIRKNSITEIKGNKHSIGTSNNAMEFSNIDLELKRDDQLYLFTDGYADQLDKAFGQKIKKRTFKNILLENKENPMKTQKQALSDYLNKWQGDYEQIDDILVVGIKL